MNLLYKATLPLPLVFLFLSYSYGFSYSNPLTECQWLIDQSCYEEARDSLFKVDTDFLSNTEKDQYTYLKGEVLLYTGSYKSAIPFYELLYTSVNVDYQYKASSRLAYLLYLMGDYEKTIDFIDEIPDENKQLADELIWARAQRDLKNYASAHEKIDALLLKYDNDYFLSQKAIIYIKESKFIEAISLYEYLIDVADYDLEHNEYLLSYYNNLMYCLNKTDLKASGEMFAYFEAYFGDESWRNSTRQSVFLQNKAEYLSRIGCIEDAILCMDQAICLYFNLEYIEQLQIDDLIDKMSLFDFYEEKLKILKRAAFYDLEEMYKKIDALIVHLKKDAVEEEIRFRKGKDYSPFYIDAFHYFLSQNKIAEAYFYISRIKDSALIQSIQEKGHLPSNGDWRTLQNAQFNNQYSVASKNQLRVQVLHNHKDKNDKNALYITVDDVQRKMRKKELILDYYKVNDAYHVFALTKDDIQYFKLDIEEQTIENLKASFTKRPDYHRWNHVSLRKLMEVSERVGKRLIPLPLESLEHIIISAHGVLAGFSFEALAYKNQYFIQSKNISYISSTALWCYALKYSSSSRRNVMISNHTSDLTGANFMHHSLAHSSFLFDTIHSDFLMDSEDYNLIHIGNHATLKSDIYQIYIALDEHKKLTIGDLMVKRLNCNVMVLAGCHTAKGQYISDEGVYALSRSAFAAGAKNVISSFHAINDDATAEILSTFYEQLEQNKSLGDALTTAKLKYLSQATIYLQHPYFWSGLVIQGNQRFVPMKTI